MQKKTANMEIKKLNRTNVFQLLRRGSGMTKQDIVATLQLCLPTVTQNINELQSEGLVCESGSVGNTGGRRAKTYDVVRDARVSIGLDITRNHITVVVVDLTGGIISRTRVREKFERTDSYYRRLGALVEQAATDADLPHERILGVGIGVPGLVTADHKAVFYGEILGFTGATCAEFSRYIPFPTALFNDAKAAGLAESWTTGGSMNVFYLMLSNNIGGSVVIGGQVYTGQNLRSGEVGHITIHPGGRKCYCGQQGCVDAYLAATELSSLTDGNLAAFFDLLKSADETATATWDQYLNHLSLTVNNLNMLFDCPVVLGGYVGEYIGDYMEEVRARTAGRNSFEPSGDYLRVCSYKTEAIAAGAALHFISLFIDSI